VEALTYSPARAAELLGVREKAVTAALDRVLYSAADVWALRQKLGRLPPSLGPTRKQLFLNFKGGTGKTSVSTNYGFRMAEMGYRVLIIDLDSQGHATKCLGYEGEEFERTLLDVLVKKIPLAEVVQATPMPNLSFVPSNLSMSTVDLALMPMAGREYKLRNALKDLEGQYDLILFDAPPSFGLLNLNALVAADDLFVPVLADFLSFHGLKLLFDTVRSLEEDLGHVLSHIFIVVNAFNQTFKLAKEALEALRTHYPEYLLPTVVRQCTKFAQASSEGVPVFVSAPDSKGAEDIQAVIDVVLKRLRSQSKRAAAK
jgi:chromosome partitioning protein